MILGCLLQGWLRGVRYLTFEVGVLLAGEHDAGEIEDGAGGQTGGECDDNLAMAVDPDHAGYVVRANDSHGVVPGASWSGR
jgi:hypothetical protein